MPAANDLRRGMAIKYNGNAAIVLEVHHRTPGNLRAFVQAIIRYINTGKSADVRFSSTDKVELVEIERKQLEFSYKDRNGYHFIDPETYDTIALQDNRFGRRTWQAMCRPLQFIRKDPRHPRFSLAFM